MRMLLFLAPFALLGCAAGPDAPAQLSARQTQVLDKALSGKVAGEKVSCISRYNQTSMQVVSNEVLLYRVSPKLVYKNELIGRCSGLDFGDTLVVQTFGSQYCRGDIARAADLRTGIVRGACALGDFVPYRTPPKG